MSGKRTTKVDFHLHSYASNVTDYYAANTFAIPESYSDPLATYRELRAQGMGLVTLTDHNSIDGVKEMLDAHLPGVFISSEMTATFPEDGCNIHVTVANMTEAQFAEVNRLRSNLYEMLDYVETEIAQEANAKAGNRIAYFMTHPLMSTQNRPYGREGALTADHIEKALLLFPCLEVRNGTRTRSLNEFTHRLVTSLDRETIERLANKHGIVPRGRTPWLKGIVAGSDDHSGINQGRTWTEFLSPEGRESTPNDLVDAIRNRRTAIGGEHGGPVTLAHAMVKLLYDGHRKGGAQPGQGTQKNPAQRTVRMGGPIHELLRFVFDSQSTSVWQKVGFQARMTLKKLASMRRKGRDADRAFEAILADEAAALLSDVEFRRKLADAARTDDRIFLVVSSLIHRIFRRYVERLRSAQSLDLIRLVKEGVALAASNVFVSLPYLVSYLHQSSDRQIVEDVRSRFDFGEHKKLVLVTDTFFEINGVARTIRKMIDEAKRRGVDFTVVTCLHDSERAEVIAAADAQRYIDSGQLRILPSIVNLDFPEYQGLQIRIPPFLDLLKYLQESGFTKMQISTPGAIGIAGLMAAKLLQIETSSTYHTSFPEYVENYTRDVSLEALAWKYMCLFYHSVDEVVVPSKFIARLLHQRGMRNRKLLILDRWVDADRFHPKHKIDDFWQRYGVPEGATTFLYVGRIGLEKNLDTLADAFVELRKERPDVHLALVGDGPYRKALEAKLAGEPVTFTGFLEGQELSIAYASADVKLFPSTTDTWGNAPLEAQASGLPVVVSDQGGPQELMVHEVTGYCVKGREVHALVDAMHKLLDLDRRKRMGAAARAFVEQNKLAEPFSAILDSDSYRERFKKNKKVAQHDEDDRSPEAVDRYLVDHRVSHATTEAF